MITVFNVTQVMYLSSMSPRVTPSARDFIAKHISSCDVYEKQTFKMALKSGKSNNCTLKALTDQILSGSSSALNNLIQSNDFHRTITIGT